jgi:hypothetical protein
MTAVLCSGLPGFQVPSGKVAAVGLISAGFFKRDPHSGLHTHMRWNDLQPGVVRGKGRVLSAGPLTGRDKTKIRLSMKAFYAHKMLVIMGFQIELSFVSALKPWAFQALFRTGVSLPVSIRMEFEKSVQVQDNGSDYLGQNVNSLMRIERNYSSTAAESLANKCKRTGASPLSAGDGFAQSTRIRQLAGSPDSVRVGEVARARALVTSPDYPRSEQMDRLATLLADHWSSEFRIA